MASIDISGLTKTYEAFRAVDAVDLHVSEGEFVIVLGPSGCGKTTTLRMLAGFIEPDGGKVVLGEREITHEPPHRRNIGLVFQNYALFPHLTIFENVAFGLRRRKVEPAEIETRVKDALSLVDLSHLADRLPRQLSGGQQQRVAIARAIAIRPDILLLDEPLSNLDAKLRLQVREELRKLQKRLGITTIMVTHDQEEAMSVGDRLVLMQSGRIEQVGTPEDLYNRPANRFVADFIGRTNFLRGQVGENQSFRTEGGLQLNGALPKTDATEVMIRPEAIRINAASTPAGANQIAAKVDNHVFLGGVVELSLALPGVERITAVATPQDIEQAGITLVPGAPVVITIAPKDVIYM